MATKHAIAKFQKVRNRENRIKKMRNILRNNMTRDRAFEVEKKWFPAYGK